MSALIITLHVIVCIALIMIVLLQTGKGSDMGAAFGGGGSQTLFGSTGASTFLSKATTIAAVIFMLTCFTLAYMSSRKESSSIMKDEPAPVEQKATENAAPDDNSASAEKAISDEETGTADQVNAKAEQPKAENPAASDQTAADVKADAETAD